MRFFITTIMLICAAAAPFAVAQAQPHLDDSLVVHLGLTLDKSAISPTNVQVKLHATDGMSDQYYASQVDPDEDDTVEWNQDLPLTVDSNYPLRLIFHVAADDGAPLPAGSAVQWEFDLDGATSGGTSVTIPAGSSGDINLTAQGTVVSQ